MPVLCGTFSIGTSCEYAVKWELWKASELRVEEGGYASSARTNWGSVCAQLYRAELAAESVYAC